MANAYLGSDAIALVRVGETSATLGAHVCRSGATLSIIGGIYLAMALKSPAAIGGHSAGHSHHWPYFGDLPADYDDFVGNIS